MNIQMHNLHAQDSLTAGITPIEVTRGICCPSCHIFHRLLASHIHFFSPPRYPQEPHSTQPCSFFCPALLGSRSPLSARFTPSLLDASPTPPSTPPDESVPPTPSATPDWMALIFLSPVMSVESLSASIWLAGATRFRKTKSGGERGEAVMRNLRGV